MLDSYYNKEGFTYIEIMMSMVIISLVSVLIASSIPASFVLTSESQNISKASILAQTYIERVKDSMSDFDIYTNVGEGSNPPVDITEDITSSGYFDVTTSVTNVGPTGYEGSLKQVDVNFSKSGTTLVNLSTIIPEPQRALQ